MVDKWRFRLAVELSLALLLGDALARSYKAIFVSAIAVVVCSLRSLDRGRGARHTLSVDPEVPSEPAQQEGVEVLSKVARRAEILARGSTCLLPQDCCCYQVWGYSLRKLTNKMGGF
jgi:hypothetical protein